MKKLLLLLSVLLIASTSFGADIPAKDRIVVLVTIDGFPFWIWKDPSLSMPTLRKLAAGGAVGPMTVINPSVTWPNHTTLVTGVTAAKHGVLFNGFMTRLGPGKGSKFEQWRPKNDYVRVPTIFDVAFKAGLTTAHVDWCAVTKAGTFTWEFAELADPNGVVEKEMVADGVLDQTDLDMLNKRNIVFRDEIWTRAGEFLVTKHHPNLLLFHLLTTDSSNHKFGPGTLASFTAYAYADSCMKRLIEALEKEYKGKYTILITTDHGFKVANKIIRSDALLRKEGLMKRSGPTINSCDVFSKSAGGSTMLYITDPAKKVELTAKLKELFGKIEGVARIYEPSEYAALGLPQPTENEQCGDLFLAAKPGYAFSDSSAEGDIVIDVAADPGVYPGHHGYLNDDPQLDGTFIAYGYGIKSGVAIERLANLDVAPTIAKLLDVQLPNVDGKPLEDILDQK